MKSLVLGFILLVAAIFLPSTPCRAEAVSDSAGAHSELDEILRRPSFQEWRHREEGELPQVDVALGPRMKSLANRFLKSIADFFDWLFRSRNRPSSAASGNSQLLATGLKALAWTALAIALIFAAVLLFKLMNKSPGTASMAMVLSRRQVHDALESGDALAMGTAQWMTEARRLADERNFRAVYRALYLALLSGLHTAGKIEHGRNRTNWTYVQHYRGPASERATFGELTDLFDHVWYGRHDSVGTQNLDQLRRKVAMLTGSGAPS